MTMLPLYKCASAFRYWSVLYLALDFSDRKAQRKWLNSSVARICPTEEMSADIIYRKIQWLQAGVIERTPLGKSIKYKHSPSICEAEV